MPTHNVLQAIQESIFLEGSSWQAARSFLSNLSEYEVRQYLGFAPSNEEPSLENRERISWANLQASLSDIGRALEVPVTFDWRNNGGLNYTTPVKNQGPCPSSIAFAVVATLESLIK